VIPRAAGRKAIDTLIKLGLFEPLPAGETREATDTKGFKVTIGPLDEDSFIVHDFLDYNDSSAYLADRRARDAARKAAGGRNGKPGGVRRDSARNPSGIQADSESPDPTRPDQYSSSTASEGQTPGEGAPESEEEEGRRERERQVALTALHPKLSAVVAILGAASGPNGGLVVEEAAVNSALSAHPGLDADQAAHEVASWVGEGSARTVHASKLLFAAFTRQRQRQGVRSAHDAPSKPATSAQLVAAMDRKRREAEQRRDGAA
ncbi:MAG TPA: hypothetical protein VFJ12_12320, partial [Segeticoccus sp.]|nr:hypothetical protein [Segeticoccus sp.]